MTYPATTAPGPGLRSYGKYRGKVVGNVDPMQQGRVQVTCPAVLGEGRASWALPSAPYGGNGVGFFTVPPVDANIWVEFEAGDPERPIWTGCFWGPGEAPAQPAVAEMKVLRTAGVTLTINDLPGAGGLILEVGDPIVTPPLRIAMTAAGIELSHGKSRIRLSQVSVSVNDGALEVI
ncbi:phage baseplate assembly protein V [Micromonospora rubida]|uniref:Phage baseplate assembly protein V n=1 Tax=Micromonospora rubida TaxID=2697657 RepID=A0ABW7SMJ5_9ACTN